MNPLIFDLLLLTKCHLSHEALVVSALPKFSPPKSANVYKREWRRLTVLFKSSWTEHVFHFSEFSFTFLSSQSSIFIWSKTRCFNPHEIYLLSLNHLESPRSYCGFYESIPVGYTRKLDSGADNASANTSIINGDTLNNENKIKKVSR